MREHMRAPIDRSQVRRSAGAESASSSIDLLGRGDAECLEDLQVLLDRPCISRLLCLGVVGRHPASVRELSRSKEERRGVTVSATSPAYYREQARENENRRSASTERWLSVDERRDGGRRGEAIANASIGENNGACAFFGKRSRGFAPFVKERGFCTDCVLLGDLVSEISSFFGGIRTRIAVKTLA